MIVIGIKYKLEDNSPECCEKMNAQLQSVGWEKTGEGGWRKSFPDDVFPGPERLRSDPVQDEVEDCAFAVGTTIEELKVYKSVV